ncbi:hypothetical protein E0H38_22595 [Rhizobium leguminosarum bv. viciae]|nr:hypothetical protein E0H32_09870 [Rhizobium leguminosarum bv. viciae]TBZ12494.1 hypothetical protein E0H38_22595 [Rhizobium leguminosarum bv. viciae]TBZ13684.1 hypothetical protein E0H33_16300 [Rhizobium leguminosarum bv. viciae]
MPALEKDPSPTPPHKGEGLPCGARCISFLTMQRVAAYFGGRISPQVSPSPLWGGVGEGFSDANRTAFDDALRIFPIQTISTIMRPTSAKSGLSSFTGTVVSLI